MMLFIYICLKQWLKCSTSITILNNVLPMDTIPPSQVFSLRIYFLPAWEVNKIRSHDPDTLSKALIAANRYDKPSTPRLGRNRKRETTWKSEYLDVSPTFTHVRDSLSNPFIKRHTISGSCIVFRRLPNDCQRQSALNKLTLVWEKIAGGLDVLNEDIVYNLHHTLT